jgi:hypothetical protein
MLSPLPNPTLHIIKQIETMFFYFVWNSKRDNIKRSVLTTSDEESGLRMANITNYIKGLKLTWLRRYITNNGNWGIFADRYLPKYLHSTGGNFTTDSKNIKNPFWSDVLEAWTLFNSIHQPDFN